VNGANIALALDLLIRYTQAAQDLANLLNTARNEGRDISEKELLRLAAQDDIARQELDTAIIAARAREGG
jgi:RNA:NAD 2'-phosphotransferase (TPT1/KptA family)